MLDLDCAGIRRKILLAGFSAFSISRGIRLLAKDKGGVHESIKIKMVDCAMPMKC